MPGEIEEDILRALRRITRAIDLHSRFLSNTFGLTGPQLVCLRAIALEETTPSRLAQRVALSQATVTGIIDRLVSRQLVVRERSTKDRRVVTVRITGAGRRLIEEAPSPLQESFVEELTRLPQAEQHQIRDILNRVATMMGGGTIEAAPVLTTSPAALSAEEMTEAVGGGPGVVGSLGAVTDDSPAIEEPAS
jgi:DNA-binding MarR family transcriptional regulator